VSGSSAADRVTQLWYDWRNRLVVTKQGAQSSEATSVQRPLAYLTYDNLSHIVARVIDTSRRSKAGTSLRRSSTSGAFFDDLLHHVDLDVPLGQEAFEPGVLPLQLAGAFDVGFGNRAELPLPDEERVLAVPVLAGELFDGLGAQLGFTQEADNLLFGETLLHDFPVLWTGKVYTISLASKRGAGQGHFRGPAHSSIAKIPWSMNS
jgi:hypothetical protein